VTDVSDLEILRQSRWYLIHAKRAREALARSNLERQGYEIYFPRLVLPNAGRDRRCDRIVPLFPGYLFLRLNEGKQCLGPVRSSVGVNGVVRFGSRYAVVPETVIRNLQMRADPASGLHRLASRALLPRTIVTVTTGPFGGLEGVFEREAGSERVVVLLKVLGVHAPINVPAQFIIASHAASAPVSIEG
jgi:transcriptional antiterminator RfaH